MAKKSEDTPPEKSTSEPWGAEAWGFPYSRPYQGQLDLMHALYTAIDKGQIGIFESPTGTGKSLSLICGAMKWLRDHENEPFPPPETSAAAPALPTTAVPASAPTAPSPATIAFTQQSTPPLTAATLSPVYQSPGGSSGAQTTVASAVATGAPRRIKKAIATPAWVHEQLKSRAADTQAREATAQAGKLSAQRTALRKFREAHAHLHSKSTTAPNRTNSDPFLTKLGTRPRPGLKDDRPAKKPRPTSTDEAEDSQYLLRDYTSDDEEEEASDSKSAETIRSQIEREFGISPDNSDDETDAPKPAVASDDQENPYVRKIFYASRTHSQLAQVVGEVQKTRWAVDVKVSVLASRKNLCINPEVKKLATVQQINDKCLDLTKGMSVTSHPRAVSKAQKLRVLHGPISTSRILEDLAKDETDAAATKGKAGKCGEYGGSLGQAELRSHILAEPADIEDIVEIGAKIKACPYYASRGAVRTAEIVLLPYSMILHKSTRESLGIDLKGHVVLLDEAHNLIETIASLHSPELSGTKILQAHAQLSQYLRRYEARLGGKNKIYISKLLFILSALLRYLSTPQSSPQGQPSATTSASGTEAPPGATDRPGGPTPDRTGGGAIQEHTAEMKNLNDFLFETHIDNLNLYKLAKFFKRSEIVKKVNGFTSECAVEVKQSFKSPGVFVEISADDFEVHRPALGAVETFLSLLTNKNSDGRVLVTRTGQIQSARVKFLLLNPEAYFHDILSQARSVVLAGGTMQPVEELVSFLISPSVPRDRITFFSCGHVIPADHLRTVIFPQGPSGVDFDFSYESRSNPKLVRLIQAFSPLFSLQRALQIQELGQAVANLCGVVPDGVVLFFPSYFYEKVVFDAWKASGLLERIEKKKKVFREPRESGEVESTLAAYARAISLSFPPLPGASSALQRGALISCVVGGKLSEGINFSDGLGRCVLVVGLPYPNATDPTLVEKLAFASHKAAQAQAASLHPYPAAPPQKSSPSSAQSPSKSPSGPLSATTSAGKTSGSAPGPTPLSTAGGSAYYESICMKAVNQSIGRAIRHVGDYAVVLLFDRRFARTSITAKLPQWISQRMATAQSFGDGYAQVTSFFKAKKDRQTLTEADRRAAFTQATTPGIPQSQV